MKPADAAELAQTLFEEIGDAAFVVDPQRLTVTDVNPMAQRLTGRSRAGLVGLPLGELFRSDADPGVRLLGQALTTTMTFHSQEGYTLARADGERTPVNLTLTRLHTQARPLGLVLARDVSERHRAHDELERRVAERTAELADALGALRLFRRLIDRTADCVLVLDPDTGRVLDANESAGSVHGFPRDQLLGRTLAELEAGGPEWADDVRLVRAHGALTREGRHRHQTGPEFPVEVSFSYVEAGRAYIVAVIRDATARQKAERHRAEEEKMEAVGRLAGGVAHDFNNLLTVINGYADLLLAELSPDDPRREPLAAILGSGERAARLTAQLLAFGRRTLAEPRWVDANEAVGRAAREIARSARPGVRIAADLGPTVGRVRIDPRHLDAVIEQLVANALEAMPAGGTLTLRTEAVDDPDGRSVRVTVSDTGVGMDEVTRARVFEPFFTTKELSRGAGMGLAAVYGLVRSAGGTVAVASRPGAGSAFSVLLPAGEVAPSASAGGGETVLLADDEEGVRRLTRLTLERAGFAVIEADGVVDAVDRAARHVGPIDVLVTDVRMPDGGGRELARRLRSARPGLRVLFISGFTDDEALRREVERGGEPFLAKPFGPQALADKVRAVLDGAG